MAVFQALWPFWALRSPAISSISPLSYKWGEGEPRGVLPPSPRGWLAKAGRQPFILLCEKRLDRLVANNDEGSIGYG